MFIYFNFNVRIQYGSEYDNKNAIIRCKIFMHITTEIQVK